MLILLLVYFIGFFVVTILLAFCESETLYKSIKDTIRIHAWTFGIDVLVTAKAKEAIWVFIFPVILFLMYPICSAIGKNKIKERKKKQTKTKDSLSLFMKKQALKTEILNAVNSFNNLSWDYKKYQMETCFKLIDMATNYHELSLAVAQCQAIIDQMTTLNKEQYRRYTTNSNNHKTNNQSKSKSSSYRYTVDGALRLLELDKTATVEDVKKAYRKLVMIHHPDKGGTKENFLKLNAAYNELRRFYNF